MALRGIQVSYEEARVYPMVYLVVAYILQAWSIGDVPRHHKPEMRLDMAKSNSVIETTVTDDGTITFKVLGAGECVFRPDDTTEVIQRKLMFYGAIQKLSDKAAQSRDTKTGLPATPAQKLEKMNAIRDALVAGEWSLRRTATGPRFDVGAVVTAMARALTNGDVDKVNRILDNTITKRGVDRVGAAKIWASSDKVAAELARMAAAAAPSGSDDLLDEMLAEEVGTDPLIVQEVTEETMAKLNELVAE